MILLRRFRIASLVTTNFRQAAAWWCCSFTGCWPSPVGHAAAITLAASLTTITLTAAAFRATSLADVDTAFAPAATLANVDVGNIESNSRTNVRAPIGALARSVSTF